MIAGCVLALVGCGSGGPAPGTQINVTIPKEVAAKQNSAYQEYAKKSRSTTPAGMSPGQQARMSTGKR